MRRPAIEAHLGFVQQYWSHTGLHAAFLCGFNKYDLCRKTHLNRYPILMAIAFDRLNPKFVGNRLEFPLNPQKV